MKIQLNYERTSQIKTDLLVVILDSQTKFHDLTGSPVDETVGRVERDIREKRIKKEYFTTLDARSNARNLIIYSTSLSTSYNVWENVKIFVRQALNVAKDLGLSRISILMNTADAVPFIGKAVEGAILGAYSF